MKLNHCIRLLCLVAIVSLFMPLSAQKSFQDYKKELRGLKGSKYISKAFDGAEDLALRGHYNLSLSLMDLALKQGKSMGRSTMAVLYSKKGEILLSSFPKDEVYIKSMIASYDEMMDRDPPQSLINDAIKVLRSGRSRMNPSMQGLVDARLSYLIGEKEQLEAETLTEVKKDEFKAFKKMDKE